MPCRRRRRRRRCTVPSDESLLRICRRQPVPDHRHQARFRRQEPPLQIKERGLRRAGRKRGHDRAPEILRQGHCHPKIRLVREAVQVESDMQVRVQEESVGHELGGESSAHGRGVSIGRGRQMRFSCLCMGGGREREGEERMDK